MALSPQLLQFKSSGVYRLEFDKSQTANINVETLRLVVGSSKKGPYNTPVLIDTVETFNDVFGGIDKSLEKKGMFFHRSAIESLTRGPILALNVGNFDENDIAYYQSLSTTGSVEGNTSVGDNDPKAYSEFFNTDKFWSPSDSETLKTIAGTVLPGEEDRDHLLNFVNIKQDSITVIARQAADVAEFNLTAREWYGEGNVPEYLNPLDRMSDFMLDIFVFKGEFDAATMSSDPIYKPYFGDNGEGLRVERLSEFANLRQVTLLAQYTGSILPGFKDLEGRNLYVESMINAEARRTGLFCAVNEEMVTEENGTNVDFVGHVVDADEDFELLSHSVEQVKSDATLLSVENGRTGETGAITVSTTLPYTVAITNVEDNGTLEDALVGEFLNAETPGEYAEVTGNTEWSETLAATNTTYNIGSSTGTADYQNAFTAIQTNPSAGVWEVALTPDAGATITSTNAALPDGKYVFGGNTRAKLVSVSNASPAADEVVILTFDAEVDSSIVSDLSTGTTFDYFDTDGVVLAEPALGSITITFDAEVNSSYNNAAVTNAVASQFYNVSTSRVISAELTDGTVAHTSGSDNFTVSYLAADIPAVFPLKVGSYVDSAVVGRLAIIQRIEKTVDGNGDAEFSIFCNIEPAFNDRYINSFANSSNYYKTFILPKANIAVKTITDYLNTLSGGNGLYDALIDKDIIDFRYVVDTFSSFDKHGINTKANLSKLAKDRENAAAILNAPTVADFKTSNDPSFKDANGVFKTQFIASGGRLDINPSSLYSLPSINEGANYAFYYAPGLVVNDSGKDIIVPPAAYVANNYIDKYTNALPWSIVAGPRRGVVSGANVKGVEYSFDKSDRDILEPFGINPIVFQRGVGLTILGNKTGQQSIKSALSSAHVREVLIYIQDGMANILKDYVFEFNNVQTRLEIKTLADSFMESVKQDGGVFEYRNIMDSTNNTNETIDNNMGIIDTYVEPVKGLEIVVHRTTVLNTGEIQSGNLG